MHQLNNTGCMGLCTDQRHKKQIGRRFRQFPETIDQLIQHLTIFIRILYRRNSLIHIQLLKFIFNVGRWDKGINININRCLEVFLNLFALRLHHSLVKHLAVQIISYSLHMSTLPFTKQITCTSDLQIPHCDPVSRSQFRKFSDCR